MIQPQSNEERKDSQLPLRPVARFPGLRALAWSGNILYASKRYELLRAQMSSPFQIPKWESVAAVRPLLKRTLTVRTNLSARLFRDGFHALAVLPSGAVVGAIPGTIATARPDEPEFRCTHHVTRGTRPLHITSVPGGAVFWGEYFDNSSRDEVHIYGSQDEGETWSPVYTFPKGAIRHIHNIVHDPWTNCLWVLTGDYGDECRILRAACDFSRIETVLQGNQQARAVAAIPMDDGLYFTTDTPLESNFVYGLGRNGTLDRLAIISSSSIYGCRVGQNMFFSTMVEPSEANRDRSVRVYAGNANSRGQWQSILNWQKDVWPMGLFQYGNAFLPDGYNETKYLAVTTIAVKSDDMVLSLYDAEDFPS